MVFACLSFWNVFDCICRLSLVCVNVRLPPGPAVHAWCWGNSNLSTSPVLLYIYSSPSSTFIICCCSFLPLSVHASCLISGYIVHLPQTSFLCKPTGSHCTSLFHLHCYLLSSSFLLGSLVPARRAGFSHCLPPASTNWSLRYSG